MYAQSSEVYFASFPCLTPDGSSLVFSHQGDLWSVDSNGGLAQRMTAMEGNESRPRISPDGKWLAFSSDMYGNEDVYLMPMGGGAIVRLTYHQGFDHVDSWSWDSKYIYLTSDRYNIHSGYKVHIDGTTPQRVFDEGYFNNSHHLVEHPVSGEVFFNESWESKRYAHRLGYKGPYNPEIKSFHPARKQYKEYTHWEGKDFWATIDGKGSVYYVSDHENGRHNLYQLQDTTGMPLTYFKHPIKRPYVSADGSKVVFERDYQLYIYDVDSHQTFKPEITFQGYDKLSSPHLVNVRDRVTYFDVSPDGEKFVFVSGGEVFISDVAGKFVQQVPTPAGGRVLEVLWLFDSESIVYNQTVKGHLNVFKMKVGGAEKILTSAPTDDRKLVLDKDRKNLLYLSGTRSLREMNVDDGKSEVLVEDEFWGIYNAPPAYAPDGSKRIVYSAIRDLERDVFLYDKQTNTSINLTKTGVGELFPVFSSSGRSLYFAADRFKPSFPRGSRDNHIYRLPLAKFSAPFKADQLVKLMGGMAEDGVAKENVFKLDTTDLHDRMERVGPRAGNQVFPISLEMPVGEAVLYVSNHNENIASIWMTRCKPYESEKTQKVKGTNGIRKFQIRAVNNHNFVLFNGAIHQLNVAKASVQKIDLNFRYQAALRLGFEQMFFETWSNVTENYYDLSHQYDLDSLRSEFEQFLPYVTNRNDLKVLINDLLGVLNTSHMRFYSKGEEEQVFRKGYTLSSGIVFQNSSPYTVDRIVESSPADKYELDIRKGDQLVQVNGKEIDADVNRAFYFYSNKSDETLELRFRRGNSEYDVKIHPQSYERFRKGLYDEWEKNNELYVSSHSGGKIAYVHMKDMNTHSLDNFLIRMVSKEYQKEGLILDLRYNQGGNVHDQVLQFLSQKAYMRWKYRDGKLTSQPNFIPSSKPMVLLINEQTLSDGEVTAEGFKRLGLGKVIGMPTYRWIIFSTKDRLVDGSSYRLPTWGCYTLDGDDLEKVGVNPDIFVRENFEDRYQQEQPQLKKAIEELLKEIN